MTKKMLTLAAAALLSMTTILTSCGGNGTTETTETSKSVAGVEDLAGAKIGVQLGTTGDILASDYEEQGSTIERFTKGADAIQALNQNKIDCVIIDEQPAKAFVEVNDGLKILDEEFALEDYAICLAKGNTELKEKVDAALAELKADGTIDTIISNYIGDDTAGKFPYTSPEGTTRENGTLVVATNAEFPPYEYKENNEIVGIDIDISQAICDKLGMELKVDDINFDAIIAAVQSGKADMGIAGMTVTEDRLQSIDFTDSYATSTQVIIVKDAE